MHKLGLQTPIVGVHKRRTDKVGTEAVLHNVELYMKQVAEYYDQLEMIQMAEKHCVFLASDDPKVKIYNLHCILSFDSNFCVYSAGHR